MRNHNDLQNLQTLNIAILAYLINICDKTIETSFNKDFDWNNVYSHKNRELFFTPLHDNKIKSKYFYFKIKNEFSINHEKGSIVVDGRSIKPFVYDIFKKMFGSLKEDEYIFLYRPNPQEPFYNSSVIDELNDKLKMQLILGENDIIVRFLYRKFKNKKELQEEIDYWDSFKN